VLAALAGRLVPSRGWERLGFARAGDYARERLGLSARALQDLARVDAQLARLRAAEAALVSGALTWTKTRLVCRIAQPEDEARWIALARRLTARALAREVRAVDVGSLEAGAVETDEDGGVEEWRECVRIRCTPSVRGKWGTVRQLARRAAGEALPTWEAMDAVAGEVLSAFPLDRAAAEMLDETAARAPAAPAHPPLHSLRAANGCAGHEAANDPLPGSEPPRFLVALIEGLDTADPFEAELGDHLLDLAGTLRSLEAYARERLGISPRKARGLLRMARVARGIPELREAWSSGRISWAQAQAILPALIEDPSSAAHWIERATGRMPTEGEGFEAMLDHAYLAWGGRENRVCKAWRVFSRDGWRCTVPGCSSYRNLHDHHIQYRSAGGSDDESNRTTLCAWHHLRGVHAGIVRISGRAPGRLRFELGVRPGQPPLVSYHPGEGTRSSPDAACATSTRG
jgi:hypothetical protein